MTSDTSTLEIVSLEEELGEDASCNGAKQGVSCDQAPVWLGKAPCCTRSILLCDECKEWTDEFIQSMSSFFFSCAGCGYCPLQQIIWTPA